MVTQSDARLPDGRSQGTEWLSQPLIRDHIDAALRESEMRFRLLFEHSPDAIFLIDPHDPSNNWPIVDCNEAAARMNGYAREEMIGQSIHIFHPQPDNPNPLEEISAQFWREGVVRGRDIHRRKDGSLVHIEYSTTLITLGGRQLVLGVDRDISVRVQAETALRASEEQFRQIAEHIQHVLWLLDWQQQRIIYISRMYEATWGRSIESLYAGRHSFLEPIHPDDRPSVERVLDNLHQGEIDQEYRIVRPDGAVRFIRDRAFPILDTDGQVYRIAGIAEDITERKQAEEERLAWERRKLELQKLESLEVLAGGIAHDFNNLLMVILGSAAVALHNLPPDVPLYDDLVMITEAGNRAADLTRQLLAYVGQGPFEIVPLDLSALLEQHSGAFRSAVGADANLHLDLDPSLPAIAADATQVYRVAVNLILNASEALVSREGTIRVSTGVIELSQAEPATSASDAELPAGSYVYLEVADTGVGMDTKTRARLFEPFFTTRFPGRGLGLAAVQGIMRRHGGAVRVSSAPGEGTTMRALFPVPARQQV